MVLININFFFQVSWVRHRDIHLLTVGRYTYTSDQRFEALHSPHSEDWALRIRPAQKKDSGAYECQVSTTPPVGHHVYLSVVGEYFQTFEFNFILNFGLCNNDAIGNRDVFVNANKQSCG